MALANNFNHLSGLRKITPHLFIFSSNVEFSYMSKLRTLVFLFPVNTKNIAKEFLKVYNRRLTSDLFSSV